MRGREREEREEWISEKREEAREEGTRVPPPAHLRPLLRQSQFRRVYEVHTLTI